jgi:hypothetical protein
MFYRKMNKAAPELSILGFKCMRFPLMENWQIDEKHATRMLRYAIDHGMNYVEKIIKSGADHPLVLTITIPGSLRIIPCHFRGNPFENEADLFP